jgi:hypothetical protein
MVLAVLPLFPGVLVVLPLLELLHAVTLAASVTVSARQAKAVGDRFIRPP